MRLPCGKEIILAGITSTRSMWFQSTQLEMKSDPVDITLFLIAYFLLLAIGMLILRIFVRRDYVSGGRLRPLTSSLQALLFFVYGGFPISYLPANWPTTQVRIWVHVLGLTSIAVGIVGVLLGMAKLGVTKSLGRGKTELVQSGLYGITRNPQAIACGFYVLGFALLWPSWYALAWALLYAVLIHAMVITEEEHLSNVYGDAYRAYCVRVPRYFHLRIKLQHRG